MCFSTMCICFSVIPYISANVYKLLPLSVVRNAAGLLCDAPVTLKMRVPTSAQCRYLNELCASTGLDFKFDATTSLVSLADVYALSDPTPYTHQLPMDDPFSHAKYIDEALHLAASTSAPAPVCAQSWYTTTNTVTTPGVLAAGSVGPVGSRPANVMSSLQPSQVGACARYILRLQLNFHICNSAWMRLHGVLGCNLSRGPA